MRKTDWLTGIKAAFELLRTFMNFIFSWTFLNFFELYSKCFELHNYVKSEFVTQLLYQIWLTQKA